MTRPYLSRRAFLQVRDLLAENVAFPAIAEQTGVCLRTIADISREAAVPSRIAEDEDHPLWEEMQQSRRCPGCGALVFVWPCLACRMNACAGAGGVKVPSRAAGLKLKDKRRRVATKRERRRLATRRQRRRAA